MALKKSIEIGNSGITGEYWRIRKDYRVINDQFIGYLECYKDQAAREANKSFIQGAIVEAIISGFSPAELDSVDVNPVNLAYTKIKSGEVARLYYHGVLNSQENEEDKNYFNSAEDC